MRTTMAPDIIKVKGKFYRRRIATTSGCAQCAFNEDDGHLNMCRQATINIRRTYFKHIKYKDMSVKHQCSDSIWERVSDMTQKEYVVQLVLNRMGEANE